MNNNSTDTLSNTATSACVAFGKCDGISVAYYRYYGSCDTACKNLIKGKLL